MKEVAIHTPKHENHFHELINAIKDALLELGYQPKIYLSSKGVREDRNIYIGTEKPFNKNCLNICIQAQQFHIHKKFSKIHRYWDRVLELFPDQVKKENTVYFPMGYSKHFDFHGEKSESIMFYCFGRSYPHRVEFCKKHNIFMGEQFYGIQRDQLIMASKFNINLKRSKREYFYAPLHGLLVLCKGKFYLQEKCQGNYGIYRDFIIDFEEENFLDTVGKWSNKNYKEYAEDIRQTLIENHKFENYFEKSIEGILP